MPDDDNDILDISFEDAEEAPAPPDVLDIELDGPTTTPPPKPAVGAPNPIPSVAEDDDDLPMTSGGTCERCGYALRPLEDRCPRCARLGPAAPAASAVVEEAAGSTALPAADSLPPVAEQPRRGCLVGGIIGSLLLLALAIAIPIAIWMQPVQRAKREYRLGLQAQLRADFETARQHYGKALELDPDMGLAAFSMGTTYLGIGDPGLMDSIQGLTERASRGETSELDQADEWFRRTLEIGQRLPSGKVLMDQKIRTPAQLRAFAHASLALTAFIRASAAMQADALDDAMAWLQVASREANSALLDDPSNSAADQILKTVTPMVPPTAGVD